jgi:hypothetical protein
VDRSYIAANDAERARLRGLIERLSDAELSRPLAAGWTVAGVLAHLALWDGRALYLLNRWESGIAPAAADHEPGHVDWVNEAAKPLCLALPPRTAAELALRLAEEVDRRVAALSDELAAQNLNAGRPLNLSRAVHRKEHLDEIERALASA